MNTGCKDCKWVGEREEIYHESTNYFWTCEHPSCFREAFSASTGKYKKRIIDFDERNKDGTCPDFEQEGRKGA